MKHIKYRIQKYKKLFKEEYTYSIEIKKLCLFWVYVREKEYQLSSLKRKYKPIKVFENEEDAINFLKWKYIGMEIKRIIL